MNIAVPWGSLLLLHRTQANGANPRSEQAPARLPGARSGVIKCHGNQQGSGQRQGLLAAVRSRLSAGVGIAAVPGNGARPPALAKTFLNSFTKQLFRC